MMRKTWFLFLLLPALLFTGCSHENSDATFGPHPSNWLLMHNAAARTDLDSCRDCHGLDFQGSGSAVSCFSCHGLNTAPPFTIHSPDWTDAYVDHRAYAATNGFSSCANAACHGAQEIPEGGVTGPSCFSATFTNAEGQTRGCHPGGPEEGVPHALPFVDPNDHGPVAKSDLAFCQSCHGIIGTTDFGGGSTGVACASCHPDAGAHPTNWQGSNDPTGDYLSSHRTAGNLGTTCSICHDFEQGRTAPKPDAPSCFSTSFTNADGSTTACHPGGPGAAPHAVPFVDPNDHGPEAKADLAFCQTCHGTPGTTQFAGGSVGVACTLCHTAADAHPTNWQGTNDTTATNNYFSSHRTASNMNTTCVICHDFEEGRTAPNPDAPSCFSASFTNADGSSTNCHATGPGAPHALGTDWLPPEFHGAEAKKDLTYCQQCHAQPFDGGPGSNPRFNVSIGNLANGCETCHNDSTAHPSVDTRDTTHWYGTFTHSTAVNLQDACSLCHGASLEGDVGPACSSCHTAGSPLTLQDCTSCHNTPPNSLETAVSARPNRDGNHVEHNQLAGVTSVCSTCHTAAGIGTNNHFDDAEPADVAIATAYNAKTGTFSFDGTAHTCAAVSCHGGQTTPNWYGGFIEVSTECEKCHTSGTSQFNSYNSGEHSRHVSRTDCFTCHDVTKLATGHFSGLDTPTFEQDPATTLRDEVNYNGSSCNDPSAAAGNCHGGNRTW